eukprot:COSAG01_NODE_539_length_15749_cov_21.448307_4_plen_1772_part_00
MNNIGDANTRPTSTTFRPVHTYPRPCHFTRECGADPVRVPPATQSPEFNPPDCGGFDTCFHNFYTNTGSAGILAALTVYNCLIIDLSNPFACILAHQQHTSVQLTDVSGTAVANRLIVTSLTGATAACALSSNLDYCHCQGQSFQLHFAITVAAGIRADVDTTWLGPTNFLTKLCSRRAATTSSSVIWAANMYTTSENGCTCAILSAHQDVFHSVPIIYLHSLADNCTHVGASQQRQLAPQNIIIDSCGCRLLHPTTTTTDRNVKSENIMREVPCSITFHTTTTAMTARFDNWADPTRVDSDTVCSKGNTFLTYFGATHCGSYDILTADRFTIRGNTEVLATLPRVLCFSNCIWFYMAHVYHLTRGAEALIPMVLHHVFSQYTSRTPRLFDFRFPVSASPIDGIRTCALCQTVGREMFVTRGDDVLRLYGMSTGSPPGCVTPNKNTTLLHVPPNINLFARPPHMLSDVNTHIAGVEFMPTHSFSTISCSAPRCNSRFTDITTAMLSQWVNSDYDNFEQSHQSCTYSRLHSAVMHFPRIAGRFHSCKLLHYRNITTTTTLHNKVLQHGVMFLFQHNHCMYTLLYVPTPQLVPASPDQLLPTLPMLMLCLDLITHTNSIPSFFSDTCLFEHYNTYRRHCPTRPQPSVQHYNNCTSGHRIDFIFSAVPGRIQLTPTAVTDSHSTYTTVQLLGSCFQQHSPHNTAVRATVALHVSTRHDQINGLLTGTPCSLTPTYKSINNTDNTVPYRHEFSTGLQACHSTPVYMAPVGTPTKHSWRALLSSSTAHFRESGYTVYAHTHTVRVITNDVYTEALPAPAQHVYTYVSVMTMGIFGAGDKQCVTYCPLSNFQRYSDIDNRDSGHFRYAPVNTHASWHCHIDQHYTSIGWTDPGLSHTKLAADSAPGYGRVNMIHARFESSIIFDWMQLHLVVVASLHDIHGIEQPGQHYEDRFSARRTGPTYQACCSAPICTSPISTPTLHSPNAPLPSTRATCIHGSGYTVLAHTYNIRDYSLIFHSRFNNTLRSTTTTVANSNAQLSAPTLKGADISTNADHAMCVLRILGYVQLSLMISTDPRVMYGIACFTASRFPRTNVHYDNNRLYIAGQQLNRVITMVRVQSKYHICDVTDTNLRFDPRTGHQCRHDTICFGYCGSGSTFYTNQPAPHSCLMFWCEHNCTCNYSFSTVLDTLDEIYGFTMLFSFQHQYGLSTTFQALISTPVDTLAPYTQGNPFSPGRTTRVSGSGYAILAYAYTERVTIGIAHTAACHTAPVRHVCEYFTAIVAADFSVDDKQLVHTCPLFAFRQNSNADKHDSDHSRHTPTSTNALWHCYIDGQYTCPGSADFDCSHMKLATTNISGRRCLDKHHTCYVFLHIQGYTRLLLTIAPDLHDVYGTAWSTASHFSHPNVRRGGIQLHIAVQFHDQHGKVFIVVCSQSGCHTRDTNVLSALWYTNTCSSTTTLSRTRRQTGPRAKSHYHVFHCNGYTLHADYICLSACDSFYISADIYGNILYTYGDNTDCHDFASDMDFDRSCGRARVALFIRILHQWGGAYQNYDWQPRDFDINDATSDRFSGVTRGVTRTDWMAVLWRKKALDNTTRLGTITTFLTPSTTADDAHVADGSTFLHDLCMSILNFLAVASWICIFGTTIAAITLTCFRWCYRLHQHQCPIQRLLLHRWCGIITNSDPLHHVWHLQSTCCFIRHPGPPGGVVGCYLYKTPSTRARLINRSSPKEYKHACPAYCQYSLHTAALATVQVTSIIMISSQQSGWLGTKDVSSPWVS